jgi:fatty-acyl-CoA synthase
VAELVRLPALIGRVAPSIVQARLRGRESWLHALVRHAERRPRAPALLFGAERIGFRELAARVEQSAAFLECEGVCEGEVIGLIGTNSIDYVVLLLAAARLGAPVALISPELDGALEAVPDHASPSVSGVDGLCQDGPRPSLE